MSGDFHGDRLGDACSYQVPHGTPSQVVGHLTTEPGFLASDLPGFLEAFNALPVAMEHPGAPCRTCLPVVCQKGFQFIGQPDNAPFSALCGACEQPDRSVLKVYLLPGEGQNLTPESPAGHIGELHGAACLIWEFRQEGQVLMVLEEDLIQAIALLHQATRERNEEECIVATMQDYRIAYDLVSDLMAYGVQTAVPPRVKKFVGAVNVLTTTGQPQNWASILGGQPTTTTN